MIGICLNMTELDLFFYSSGTLPWQPILWQNLGISVHSAERRLKTACNIAIPIKKIFSGNILATSVMKIGPVTPEITRVINAPFWMRRQKSAYLTEYLTSYWNDHHQRFSFGRHMYGDNKNYIRFVVVQGTLLW